MEELFSAGNAFLKIGSLVKTPLHEFMAVERSGLWAPVPVYFKVCAPPLSCFFQFLPKFLILRKFTSTGADYGPFSYP